jgi:hypothetical protein
MAGATQAQQVTEVGERYVPENVDVGRRRGPKPVVEAEVARRRAATYIPRSSKDPALKAQ